MIISNKHILPQAEDLNNYSIINIWLQDLKKEIVMFIKKVIDALMFIKTILFF